jgi:hypothetical protein
MHGNSLVLRPNQTIAEKKRHIQHESRQSNGCAANRVLTCDIPKLKPHCGILHRDLLQSKIHADGSLVMV